MKVLEKRVDKLERAIMELVYVQHRTEMEIQELKREMEQFKEEIREDTRKLKEEFKAFKDEMKQFKDEMKQFKDEMKQFKDEMKQFKDEMSDFKDEMKEFKDEMKQEVKRMNKQWGDLANRLGTIVEDIIFPATAPVIKKFFGCEVNDIYIGRKVKKGDLKDEFDVIAVCDETKTVFLIEVKAFPKVEYINEFKNNKVERFLKLLPEYENYKLVLIFASLRLPDDIVNYLTKQKIYAMAYREWEYMDLLNFEEV